MAFETLSVEYALKKKMGDQKGDHSWNEYFERSIALIEQYGWGNKQ